MLRRSGLFFFCRTFDRLRAADHVVRAIFFLAVTIKTKEAGLPVQVQARVGTILQDAYIPSIQQT